jgi:hypothetical protein
MVGAHPMESKQRKRLLWIASFAVALVIVWWWKGGLDRVIAATSSGREKAQALVAAYAKHVGAHDAAHQTLDENNDRSFGDFGFHYFPERDVLEARVFIVRSHIKDWPDRASYEWRSQRAMDDPKIGGLYEHGGGHFVLDEDKQICFLVKDYPVASTSVAAFISDMDRLVEIGARWSISWAGHVAVQAAGAEPIPSHPVTLENDPYKR